MTEDEWYLTLLAQEASELIKEITKALMFTPQGHHPSTPTVSNLQRMSTEAFDVRTLHDMCIMRGLLYNMRGDLARANPVAPYLEPTLVDRPNFDIVERYNYSGKIETVKRWCELAKQEGKIHELPIVSVVSKPTRTARAPGKPVRPKRRS